MCCSSLIFVCLIVIVEITPAQIAINRQNKLWSQGARYPKISVENFRPPYTYDFDPKILKKFNPNQYHQKKYHRWLDPINYKEPRVPKRFNEASRSSQLKIEPVENWNQEDRKIKDLKYSGLPSVYLEPPKLVVNGDQYEFYSKSEKPVAGKIKLKSKGRLENHRQKFTDDDEIKEEEEEEEEKEEKEEEEEKEEDADEDQTNYIIRDHAPEQQIQSTENEFDEDEEESSKEEIATTPESQKDRIEFHIHGHQGPETYIFGYDTGDGNNRQYRLEERHEDGSVTGHYGYIDARGKLRKVRYKATPTEGYQEQHHETNEH